MKQMEGYRAHAEECRTLARKMQTKTERDQLLKMAEAWDRFAEERERLLQSGR